MAGLVPVADAEAPLGPSGEEDAVPPSVILNVLREEENREILPRCQRREPQFGIQEVLVAPMREVDSRAEVGPLEGAGVEGKQEFAAWPKGWCPLVGDPGL